VCYKRSSSGNIIKARKVLNGTVPDIPGGIVQFLALTVQSMDKRKSERIVIDVAVILFPHFVPLPFYSYSIACLIAIILNLRKQKMTLLNIGLKRNGLTINSVIIGIL
jgi:hypothetical protein